MIDSGNNAIRLCSIPQVRCLPKTATQRSYFGEQSSAGKSVGYALARWRDVRRQKYVDYQETELLHHRSERSVRKLPQKLARISTHHTKADLLYLTS
jgi:hypothetical protein